MEVSALRYTGVTGLHGRSRLLRLQSDERLIAMVRRGNPAAFEVLVSRYQSRLLAFCRHLLGSREDAEDVLQEVMTAAFNAMVADERPINVRPWLYRIARNRCLNHLRRVQAVATDTMDLHLSDFGASTADKVHKAEEFRLLVDDIQRLPETQRTALVLREMDALSYEQISEAMETTVPSVKSLLVRARLSLAEAAEARLLSCEQVRIELAEVAEGIVNRASSPVRRHLRTCQRCATFQSELKRTSKVLAALMPLGPLALAKQLLIAHLGHSAGAGASSGASGAGTGAAAAGSGAAAAGSGAAAAGSGAVAGSGAAVGSSALAGGAFAGGSSLVPVGIGAIATKAAAGLAAAAIVTTTAVAVSHTTHAPRHPTVAAAAIQPLPQPVAAPVRPIHVEDTKPVAHHARRHVVKAKAKATTVRVALTTTSAKTSGVETKHRHKTGPDGTTETQTVTTVLSSGPGGAGDQGSSACSKPPSTPVTSAPPSSEPSSTPSTTSSTTASSTTTAPADASTGAAATSTPSTTSQPAGSTQTSGSGCSTSGSATGGAGSGSSATGSGPSSGGSSSGGTSSGTSSSGGTSSGTSSSGGASSGTGTGSGSGSGTTTGPTSSGSPSSGSTGSDSGAGSSGASGGSGHSDSSGSGSSAPGSGPTGDPGSGAGEPAPSSGGTPTR